MLIDKYLGIKELVGGTGEMAQWSKATTALTDDQGSVPRTHNRGLTTACDCSSRGSNTLSGLMDTAHSYIEAYTKRHTCTFN